MYYLIQLVLGILIGLPIVIATLVILVATLVLAGQSHFSPITISVEEEIYITRLPLPGEDEEAELWAKEVAQWFTLVEKEEEWGDDEVYFAPSRKRRASSDPEKGLVRGRQPRTCGYKNHR